MDIKTLIEQATRSRERSYDKYSHFKVGAALMTDTGKIFRGCNVENISFGLTICAERVALGAAVEAGASKFVALAVVSDSLRPVVPCGACRQVLAEFSPDLKIFSATLQGQQAEFDLADLLPIPNQGILG